MSTGLKVLIASRPKTLVAIVAPLLIASAMVKSETGSFDFKWLGLIFIASLLIQVATNFYNDALDGEEKRDTKKRLGPKRFSHEDQEFLVLLKGLAFGCLSLAAAIGLLLTFKGGLIVFLLGAPALFLAYLYTGTKYSLSTNGVADPFVLLYFGVIPVSLTYYIVADEFLFETLIMGLASGFLSNTLLVINNLRDEEEDKENDKKTLIVRFGRSFGLKLLALCLFAPYFLNILWFGTIYFRASLYSLLCVPMAVLIFILVCKNKASKKYNRYLGLTALHLLLFSLAFSIGVMSS